MATFEATEALLKVTGTLDTGGPPTGGTILIGTPIRMNWHGKQGCWGRKITSVDDGSLQALVVDFAAFWWPEMMENYTMPEALLYTAHGTLLANFGFVDGHVRILKMPRSNYYNNSEYEFGTRDCP